AEKNQLDKAESCSFAMGSKSPNDKSIVNKLYKPAISINKSKNGVMLPITEMTCCTLSMTTTATNMIKIKLPTKVSNPNCWLSNEPAPANITTPTPNNVKIMI